MLRSTLGASPRQGAPGQPEPYISRYLSDKTLAPLHRRPGGARTDCIPPKHRAPPDPADRVDNQLTPPRNTPKNRNLEALHQPNIPESPPSPPKPINTARRAASAWSDSRIARRAPPRRALDQGGKPPRPSTSTRGRNRPHPRRASSTPRSRRPRGHRLTPPRNTPQKSEPRSPPSPRTALPAARTGQSPPPLELSRYQRLDPERIPHRPPNPPSRSIDQYPPAGRPPAPDVGRVHTT